MSSPHVVNGHDNGMVLSSDVGACGLLANFWQAMQRRTISSVFLMAVGNRILLESLLPRVLDCWRGACRCLHESPVEGLCRLLRLCTFGVPERYCACIGFCRLP